MTLNEAFGAWHAHPQPNMPARQMVLDAMKADPTLVAAMKDDIARLEQDRGGKKIFEADYISGERRKALLAMIAEMEKSPA